MNNFELLKIIGFLAKKLNRNGEDVLKEVFLITNHGCFSVDDELSENEKLALMQGEYYG